MKRTLALVAPVLAAALCGCGSTATLGGKVTYQGRPVASGSVIVLHADGTARSGVIQPDGTYAVEGVQRGHVRIGVLSPDPAHARSILHTGPRHAPDSHKSAKDGRAPARPKAPGWFPLPHDLGDPEKSGLACDVTSAHTRHDIDM